MSLDLTSIQQDLETHIEKLNHFDKWMLGKLNMVIEDSERMMSEYLLGQFGENVITMVR